MLGSGGRVEYYPYARYPKPSDLNTPIDSQPTLLKQNMKIILSGNPLSTQSIYRYVCRGRFATCYMSKKGKDLKNHYQLEVREQHKGKVIKEDCELDITLFFGDKRRRDVDNFNKLVLDSLQGIVFEDDKQIQKLTITKNYCKENPRIEIVI